MSHKQVHVIGGGTISHVRGHFALCAPAYGATARKISEICGKYSDKMEVNLHLTKMADQRSELETPDDIKKLVDNLVSDNRTKIIFFSPAMVDFKGHVGEVTSGKYSTRLKSRDDKGGPISHVMQLEPYEKMIARIRKNRKDIFLVGFKTTCGFTDEEQYHSALRMMKLNSCNLVLANDTKSRLNMIVVPEEATYCVTKNRGEVLQNLVEIAYLRSHLTFTRSSVISGESIPWTSDVVPQTLRKVVDYCIEKGAYKPFLGVTTGHFASRIDDKIFLTSRRKTDFNEIRNIGLVKIITDGPDRVIAYGGKPSVGGQSQRIIFSKNPNDDCIVHFHCPKKDGSNIFTVSQRAYECGSHECGENTANGLKEYGNIKAVYLDNHGPNIVFAKDVAPDEVIAFIEANFDLSSKTGGYMV